MRYPVQGERICGAGTTPEDGIVPLRCSEEYKALYGDAAELKVIDGENHLISRRRNQVVAETVAFFRRLLHNPAD